MIPTAPKKFRRDPATIGRITRTPGTCFGRYRIAGTRIPVTAIKEFRAVGYSLKAIRREYPDLTFADIKAALRFRSARATKGRAA